MRASAVKLGSAFLFLVFLAFAIRETNAVWFILFIFVGIPLLILSFFDMGRSLRALPNPSRVVRMIGNLFALDRDKSASLCDRASPHRSTSSLAPMRFLRYAPVLSLLCLAAIASPSQPVPNTLDEAYASLDGSLEPEEKLAFMQRPEREAVVEAHFGVGLYIRNQWLRSGKSALAALLADKGAQSFDDMSSMILTSYWRHLYGQAIRLEEQGACYKRWWLEQQKLIDQAKSKGENSYSGPDFYCPP